MGNSMKKVIGKKWFKVFWETIIVDMLMLLVVSTVTAQAETIFFQDSFENAAVGQIPDGWTESWPSAMAWGVVSDGGGKAYSTTSMPSSAVSISYAGNRSWTDYKVETKIKITGDWTDAGSRIGIAVRYTDDYNYYRFYYDHQANKFAIVKIANNVTTALGNTTTVGTPPSADQYHTYAFEIVSNQMKGYYDGQLVLTVLDPDNSLPTGKFGLYAFKQNACYDDVVVIQSSILTVDLSDPDNIQLPVDVHPPITLTDGPVLDGIMQAVPAELGNQEKAALGLVDVTTAPFGADPAGIRDSTQAIQKAIDFAREHQMITWFPSGTYKVTDTLVMTQGLYLRTNLSGLFNFEGMPCVLMGSKNGTRPKIVLQAGSTGFNDVNKPKFVIQYKTYSTVKNGSIVTIDKSVEQGNMLFNGMILNLDIQIDENNPGAIGIYMNSAEGSAIQDVSIDVTNGYGGIKGAAGNGGSWTNVTVTGGQYGLIVPDWTVPGPVMEGITLINQTTAAITSACRGSLTITGLNIQSQISGPVIVQNYTYAAFDGTMNIIDSQIVFNGSTPGIVVASPVRRSIYLNNVYAQNASEIVAGELNGNSSGWFHVKEFALGKDVVQSGTQFYGPVYLDGVKQLSNKYQDTESGVLPPNDLQSKHVWDDNFPGFESAGVANVKSAPYNATGDGITDDTAAIQNAINNSNIVLLPKGYYRVTGTLQLKPGTKLIGIAQHLSVIYVRDPSGYFGDANNPQPIVRTANDENANTVIAFCRISTPYEVANTFTGAAMPAYSLDWQCGRKSIINQVAVVPIRVFGFKIDSQHKYIGYKFPIVHIANNGGGKWYNYNSGLAYIDCDQAMRHILVENTTQPMYFYSLEPQCIKGSDAVPIPEPITIEINNGKYISMFGCKTEGDGIFVKLTNSDHIRIFGHSGIGTGVQGGSLYSIENTPDFLIANMSDQIYLLFDHPVYSSGFIRYCYSEFYPIKENGVSVPSNERPAVYKRGNPLETNIIFDYDFENASVGSMPSGWTRSYGAQIWKIEQDAVTGNKSFVSDNETEGLQIAYAGQSVLTDYKVKARIKVDSWYDPNVGKFGLAARYADGQRQYAMYYTPVDSKISIVRRQTTTTVLKAVVVPQDYRPVLGDYSLCTFEVTGDTTTGINLTASINGYTITTTESDLFKAYTNGYFGLYASRQKVYFDDVVVTTK